MSAKHRPLPRDDFERYTRTWTAAEGIITRCEELAAEHDVDQHYIEDLREAALEPLLEVPEDEESAFMRKLAVFFDQLPEEGWSWRR